MNAFRFVEERVHLEDEDVRLLVECLRPLHQRLAFVGKSARLEDECVRLSLECLRLLDQRLAFVEKSARLKDECSRLSLECVRFGSTPTFVENASTLKTNALATYSNAFAF
jgi:hypothetical protein